MEGIPIPNLTIAPSSSSAAQISAAATIGSPMNFGVSQSKMNWPIIALIGGGVLWAILKKK